MYTPKYYFTLGLIILYTISNKKTFKKTNLFFCIIDALNIKIFKTNIISNKSKNNKFS